MKRKRRYTNPCKKCIVQASCYVEEIPQPFSDRIMTKPRCIEYEKWLMGRDQIKEFQFFGIAYFLAVGFMAVLDYIAG